MTARIYKTSGDFDNLVPITLSADGRSVVSFPAPSDLTGQSTPVKLTDGWLLDRRGVGRHTAFTRYTYAEYAALAQAPSPEALLKAVIPGAVVTQLIATPIPYTPDVAPECDSLIRAGLPGCKILLPTLK